MSSSWMAVGPLAALAGSAAFDDDDDLGIGLGLAVMILGASSRLLSGTAGFIPL